MMLTVMLGYAIDTKTSALIAAQYPVLGQWQPGTWTDHESLRSATSRLSTIQTLVTPTNSFLFGWSMVFCLRHGKSSKQTVH